MASDIVKKLFEAGKPGGVYWLKSHVAPADVSKLCKAQGMAFFHLEGKKIEGKDQFLNHASMAMHFPAHFGNNWDAFEDCITDLEWIKSDGYVIYFDHAEAFAEHHESQLETVLELFQDAVSYWKGEGKSMLVLFSGTQVPEGIKRI
jgi:RNAse (barnase) inhibitor barstar